VPGIHIIDVTNRDAAQSARRNFSKLQKTMINLYLNGAGIYQSEFGFPTVTHESNYLRANLKLRQMGVLDHIILSGWVRAVPEDIERTFSLVPEIEHLNISISTSQLMIQGKWQGRKRFKDIVKDMTKTLNLAKSKGVKTVGVNAEDASRTQLAHLIEFAVAAKEHGADRLRYCDTVGCDNPFTIYENIKAMAKAAQIPIELHCHNDLGMAVANTVAGAMAAIEEGIDAYPNTTINGIGERAGNADLISVILAIMHSSKLGEDLLGERVNLSSSWKIANYVSRATGVPIAFNQPGVGPEMFAVASGIHADAVIKDPKTYELYEAELLGRGEPELVETGREILMGDYIGTRGFRNVCERSGIELPEEENKVQEIWVLARFANVHNQAMLTPDELRFIISYPEIAWEIITVNRPS
jgi:isopropylmalate/homocitrate/citramalate synthase